MVPYSKAIAFHFSLYKLEQTKTEFVTSRSDQARLQATSLLLLCKSSCAYAYKLHLNEKIS